MRTKKDKFDRFPIAKRGYDPEAVEAYLELTVADSDRMLNEAAARIAALEMQLEEVRRQEEAVHLTILAATKTKEDMIEAARHRAAELTANGGKEGNRIVTDARMQAFQLVTGARKEAETILGEARAEVAAIARVDDDLVHVDPGPTDRELTLQRRVEEMQQVIAAMELELASRPVPSDDAPIETNPSEVEQSAPSSAAADTQPELDEQSPEPVADESLPSDDSVDDDSHIQIVVSDTPPEEPTIEISADDTEITLGEEEEALETAGVRAGSDGAVAEGELRAASVRRSFYSRRSAGLPHLGPEAGRGAMAAVAGLRTNFVAADAGDDTDPDQTPAFEAV